MSDWIKVRAAEIRLAESEKKADGQIYVDLDNEDGLIADTYRRFLDAALDEPAVKMVVTWGLSDRHSWIVRRETYQAKWRADDAASRPLPFDADLEAKPAFEAIARAFEHAPARTAG